MSYIDKMIGSVMRNLNQRYLKISDSILTEGKNDNNTLNDELKNIEKICCRYISTIFIWERMHFTR